jgi:hypothetical protein
MVGVDFAGEHTLTFNPRGTDGKGEVNTLLEIHDYCGYKGDSVCTIPEKIFWSDY